MTPFRFNELTLLAPAGFSPLDRRGDSLELYHQESLKVARVSHLAFKISSDPADAQAEVDYACAKVLRELEKDCAHAGGGDLGK